MCFYTLTFVLPYARFSSFFSPYCYDLNMCASMRMYIKFEVKRCTTKWNRNKNVALERKRWKKNWKTCAHIKRKKNPSHTDTHAHSTRITLHGFFSMSHGNSISIHIFIQYISKVGSVCLVHTLIFFQLQNTLYKKFSLSSKGINYFKGISQLKIA